MKAKDLRGLTVEELLNKETETKDDLFKLRFKHGIRRLENPATLNQLRKDIARIQTIRAEKQTKATL
jgi:large subunit ribosomal protein L29